MGTEDWNTPALATPKTSILGNVRVSSRTVADSLDADLRESGKVRADLPGDVRRSILHVSRILSPRMKEMHSAAGV